MQAQRRRPPPGQPISPVPPGTSSPEPRSSQHALPMGTHIEKPQNALASCREQSLPLVVHEEFIILDLAPCADRTPNQLTVAHLLREAEHALQQGQGVSVGVRHVGCLNNGFFFVFCIVIKYTKTVLHCWNQCRTCSDCCSFLIVKKMQHQKIPDVAFSLLLRKLERVSQSIFF